jgi:hypothetical protein
MADAVHMTSSSNQPISDRFGDCRHRCHQRQPSPALVRHSKTPVHRL